MTISWEMSTPKGCCCDVCLWVWIWQAAENFSTWIYVIGRRKFNHSKFTHISTSIHMFVPQNFSNVKVILEKVLRHFPGFAWFQTKWRVCTATAPLRFLCSVCVSFSLRFLSVGPLETIWKPHWMWIILFSVSDETMNNWQSNTIHNEAHI